MLANFAMGGCGESDAFAIAAASQHVAQGMALARVAEFQLFAEHVEGFVPAEPLELHGVCRVASRNSATGVPHQECHR